MNLSSFIDPFFCWWSFQLFPVFGYYKVAMNIHIQVGICTNFHGCRPGVKLLGHRVVGTHNFTVNFPKWWNKFIFPPAINDLQLLHILTQHWYCQSLLLLTILYYPHWDFNLHFLDVSNVVKYLSQCAYSSSGYPHLWRVCSKLLVQL